MALANYEAVAIESKVWEAHMVNLQLGGVFQEETGGLHSMRKLFLIALWEGTLVSNFPSYLVGRAPACLSNALRARRSYTNWSAAPPAVAWLSDWHGILP